MVRQGNSTRSGTERMRKTFHFFALFSIRKSWLSRNLYIIYYCDLSQMNVGTSFIASRIFLHRSVRFEIHPTSRRKLEWMVRFHSLVAERKAQHLLGGCVLVPLQRAQTPAYGSLTTDAPRSDHAPLLRTQGSLTGHMYIDIAICLEVVTLLLIRNVNCGYKKSLSLEG